MYTQLRDFMIKPLLALAIAVPAMIASGNIETAEASGRKALIIGGAIIGGALLYKHHKRKKHHYKYKKAHHKHKAHWHKGYKHSHKYKHKHYH